jgi:hypothetical protein
MKTNIQYYCLFGLLSLFMGCRSGGITTSTAIEYYITEKQAGRALAGSWLLIPIVAINDYADPAQDYGFFIRKIHRVRPAQKVIIYGSRKHKLSVLQRQVYEQYRAFVRQHRATPDSLMEEMRGITDTRILLAPVIYSHTVYRSEEGYYHRRVVLHLTGWDNENMEKIFKGSCVAIHRAYKKEGLISGKRLLAAAQNAFAEKVIVNPLSSLEPQSKSDF